MNSKAGAHDPRTLKALRMESEQFARDHLTVCAAEMLAMSETGILPDGRVRELATKCQSWSTPAAALHLAQSLVHLEALRRVVRLSVEQESAL